MNHRLLKASQFFLALLCLPGISSETNVHPADLSGGVVRVLVLKQNIAQYNAVFHGARDHLLQLDRSFVIDTVDVVQKQAITSFSKLDEDYDIVVSIGTKAFAAATTHFPDKSHVFGMVLNVDEPRITEMSRNSGKPIIGVSILNEPEAYIDTAKQIQADVKKIGLLYFADDFDSYVTDFSNKAEKLGVSLVVEKLSKKKEFVKKFKKVLKSNIDSFLIMPDFSVYDPKSLEHVIVNTYNRRIPCIGPSESFVNSGALWAFNVLPENVGTQIGELIANGVTGSDKLITYYSPSSVSINMIVAENLEIDIPYRVRKTANLIDLRRQHEN